MSLKYEPSAEQAVDHIMTTPFYHGLVSQKYADASTLNPEP